MKVHLLPSCFGTKAGESVQYLTTFLINETVAIDAGSLGLYGNPEAQARVKHVFLSHTHIDHLATLPVFLENAYEGKADAVTIHASAEVLACLRGELLNGRLWPDFLALSRPENAFLRLDVLHANDTVEVEGLRITPVSVDHAVPTFGFLVDDGMSAVAFSSDTGPTEALWQAANEVPHLKAVFLEATFPRAMSDLAKLSGHLTTESFENERRKLHRPVPVYAVHLKSRYREQVVRELHALGEPRIAVATSDRPYEF